MCIILKSVCASLNVKLCIFGNRFKQFGQLITGRIVEIVATKCQILRLKCTKIDSAGEGAYSAPPDSLAGFKGLILREGERWEWRKEGGEVKGEEGTQCVSLNFPMQFRWCCILTESLALSLCYRRTRPLAVTRPNSETAETQVGRL